jgi:hypothetical protein
VTGDGDQDEAVGSLRASAGTPTLDGFDHEPGRLPCNRCGLEEQVSVEVHDVPLPSCPRT